MIFLPFRFIGIFNFSLVMIPVCSRFLTSLMLSTNNVPPSTILECYLFLKTPWKITALPADNSIRTRPEALARASTKKNNNFSFFILPTIYYFYLKKIIISFWMYDTSKQMQDILINLNYYSLSVLRLHIKDAINLITQNKE